MMISTKGRYALRILSELSALHDGEYVSLKDISDSEGISMKYLEAITALLLKHNFVESRRGRSGGYRLSKLPSEYTLLEILKPIEGSISPVSCIDYDYVKCGRDEHCSAYPLWIKLNEVMENYLESVTLEDLTNGNL